MIYLVISYSDGYEPIHTIDDSNLCHRAVHSVLKDARSDAYENRRDGGSIFEIDPENLTIKHLEKF